MPTHGRSGWLGVYLPWFWLIALAGMVLTAAGGDAWTLVLVWLAASVGWLAQRDWQRPPLGLLVVTVLWLSWAFLGSQAWLPGEATLWRTQLAQLGVETRGWSPQPVWSSQRLAYALGAVALLGALVGYRAPWSTRMRLLSSLVYGLVALATVGIVANLFGMVHPGTPHLQVFSYLPNRNQWALLLAQGVVLGLGLALRSESAPARVRLLAAVLVLGFALAQIGSEACLVLATVGSAYLLAAHALGDRWARWAPRAVALAALAVVLIFGGALLLAPARPQIAPASTLTQEVRRAIYLDTGRLIADQPWQGVGLGNFADVFPQYREASLSLASARHPESDWLWVTAELGLPGLLLTLALVGGLAVWAWSQRARQDRYHQMAAVAAWLLLGHSLVDVSGHRLVTVAAFGLLYALSLPAGPDRSGDARTIGWTVALGRCLAPLGLGAALVLLAWSPQGWTRTAALARVTTPAAAERAVSRIPLDAWVHFRRAQLAVQTGDFALASREFRLARRLAPYHAELALREARLWAPHSAPRAIAAWREALTHGQGLSRRQLFSDAWHAAEGVPGGRQALVQLSSLHPDYRLEALLRMSPEELRRAWSESGDNAIGDTWSIQDQGAVLLRYLEAGGADGVAERLAATPELERRAPWLLAWSLASAGDYAAASERLREVLPVAKVAYGENLPTSLLELRLRQQPNDLASAQALAQRLLDADRADDALALFSRLDWSQKMPSALLYWRARAVEASQGPQAAWREWPAYLKARWAEGPPAGGADTHPGSAAPPAARR